MKNNTNRLLSILQRESSITIPGIYDPLSAKLAEINGFSAAWVSGFCVSTSLFVPDENHLTIGQYVQRVSDIRRVSAIPLIVDCDEGYGDVSKTCDLVGRLNDIGVEACCLEDNRYPKVNSFKEVGNRSDFLEDEGKFMEKIWAIKSGNPSMQVVARTESLIAGESLSEAVRRGRLYQSAGADLIVIHSKSKSLIDFAKIAEAWGTPSSLVVIPTLAQDIHFEELAQVGFKVIILANQILRSAISDMYEVYSKIKIDSGINELNKGLVSMNFIFDLIDNHYNSTLHV